MPHMTHDALLLNGQVKQGPKLPFTRDGVLFADQCEISHDRVHALALCAQAAHQSWPGLEVLVAPAVGRSLTCGYLNGTVREHDGARYEIMHGLACRHLENQQFIALHLGNARFMLPTLHHELLHAHYYMLSETARAALAAEASRAVDRGDPTYLDDTEETRGRHLRPLGFNGRSMRTPGLASRQHRPYPRLHLFWTSSISPAGSRGACRRPRAVDDQDQPSVAFAHTKPSSCVGTQQRRPHSARCGRMKRIVANF